VGSIMNSYGKRTVKGADRLRKSAAGRGRAMSSDRRWRAHQHGLSASTRRDETTFSPTGFTNHLRLGLVRGVAEPQTGP
jgi:hypothetical protein